MEYVDCFPDNPVIKYHVTLLDGYWTTLCHYHLDAQLSEEQHTKSDTGILSYFVIKTDDNCEVCDLELAELDSDMEAELRNERYLSYCW